MSIKIFRCIWIKIRIEDNKFLRISIPIPLYIFMELLECAQDLLSVLCFFTPRKSDLKVTPRAMKEIVKMFSNLLTSISESESYDLVDVTTDTVKVMIKIK